MQSDNDFQIDVPENDVNLWQTIPEAMKMRFRALPKEKSVFQIPISSFPFQPWSRHANPSAWFNYDLNAQTWSLQASKQNRLRNVILQQQNQALPNLR